MREADLNVRCLNDNFDIRRFRLATVVGHLEHERCIGTGLPVERGIKVQPIVTVEPRVKEWPGSVCCSGHRKWIVAQDIDALLYRDFNGGYVVFDVDAVHDFKATAVGKRDEDLICSDPRAEVKLTWVPPRPPQVATILVRPLVGIDPITSRGGRRNGRCAVALQYNRAWCCDINLQWWEFQHFNGYLHVNRVHSQITCITDGHNTGPIVIWRHEQQGFIIAFWTRPIKGVIAVPACNDGAYFNFIPLANRR